MTRMTRTELMKKIRIMYSMLSDREEEMIRALYFGSEIMSSDVLLYEIGGLPINKLRRLEFQMKNTIRKKVIDL